LSVGIAVSLLILAISVIENKLGRSQIFAAALQNSRSFHCFYSQSHIGYHKVWLYVGLYIFKLNYCLLFDYVQLKP